MSALEYAVEWVQNGIAVIPCLQRSKTPALDSWREYQQRLPAYDEVGRWFARPGYNLAVITGWRGLVVIDFDDLAVYKAWQREHEQLDNTLSYKVITARGIHLYFYADEPARTAKLQGCDVKAAGGYVLAPPSIHPCGVEYTPLGAMVMIQRIPSVADIMPGYVEAVEAQWTVRVERDPFDEAMSDHESTGTTIEAIKARVTPATLLGVPEPRGRAVMVRCPIHGDEHPSMSLYPDGRWYCHACRQGGDVIDLEAAMQRVDVPTAMRALAAR